jgi:sucrose-6-phosphate hydrolase SacC (GH32 family)
MPTAIQTVAALMENEPHAPHYHFIAPEGKAHPFDPNGTIWWNERYHLFYIFQDAALPNGGHCWGHVSSADLLHWDFHPTALASPEGDSDTVLCARVAAGWIRSAAVLDLGAGPAQGGLGGTQ